MEPDKNTKIWYEKFKCPKCNGTISINVSSNNPIICLCCDTEFALVEANDQAK